MCPMYEYDCEECGVIEKLMKFEDSSIEYVKCNCGRAAKRKVSASSFELTGGGWFNSGYTKSE